MATAEGKYLLSLSAKNTVPKIAAEISRELRSAAAVVVVVGS